MIKQPKLMREFMIDMNYQKYNFINTFVVLIVLVSASGSLLAKDILDGYINNFIAKSDDKDDKLLGLLADTHGKINAPSKQVEKSKATSSLFDEDLQQQSVKPDEAIKKLNESRILRQKTKELSIDHLESNGDSDINNQLQGLLSQLKSLSFPEPQELNGPEPKLELEAEPVVVEEDIEVEKEIKTITVLERQVVLSEVRLPVDQSRVVDTFEVAESLFHIGDKTNALLYYRKSFSKSLPMGNKTNPKRAWVLFQIGNCLYNADHQEAMKAYEQLITEHPSSDWTNCARTKLQVLTWLADEKPMALTMNEVK
jgi:tetratricopeptide (TPR) repeat protein